MNQAMKEKIEAAIQGRLEDDKETVRFTAIKAMSMLKGTVNASVSELIKCMVDGDKREREQSKLALMEVGEEAVEPLINILERGVRDPDWNPEEDDPEDQFYQDQDARLNAISILTEIYLRAEHEDEHEGGCCNGEKKRSKHDQAFIDLLKEAGKELITDIITGLKGQKEEDQPKEEN